MSAKRPPPADAAVEDDAATRVYDGGPAPASGPLQVISRKTPGELEPPAPQPEAQLKRPRIRAISEVTPLPNAQPANLGYLAPPRDPAAVRARRVRELVGWGAVVMALAAVVAAAIWFVAR